SYNFNSLTPTLAFLPPASLPKSFYHSGTTVMEYSVVDTSLESALTSSRQTILSSLLTLFSTKSKSKTAPQLIQPPHSISHLSSTTISIGPHSIQSKLFIAEWQQSTQTQTPPPPPPTTTPAPVQPPPAPPPAAITPALILRLNAASAADPILATLLRKAASGGASNQELSGLARYIEGLRREEELLNPTLQQQPPPPPLPPVPVPSPIPPPAQSTSKPLAAQVDTPKPAPPPSLILEFKESPTERFIIPSHSTFTLLPLDYPISTPSTNAKRRSVMLSFFVFGPGTKGKAKEGTVDETGVPVPVDLVFEDCTEAVRNAIWKCSRSGRPKDAALEDWFHRTILAIPPRLPIISRERLPTPPPEAPLPVLPQIVETPFVVGKRGGVGGKRSLVAALGSEGSGSDSPARRTPAKRGKKGTPAVKRGASASAAVGGKVSEGAAATPTSARGARSSARPRIATVKAQEAALDIGMESEGSGDGT
ncbi:hypothetical protein P7C70_g9337, partial [Phenoliferia sp. Uapishka_3]